MQEKVLAYYPKVDQGDLDWVVSLFADDGIYDRAGALYSGKPAIADFYLSDRKIQGKHTIEHAAAAENVVLVNGVFEGVGADGAHKRIGFADVWEFNPEGLVVARKTYLATGSDYVKA